jgi:hypothetical protein
MYIHTFYCASQGSVQPVPALRYWVDFWVGPKVEAALRLLGVRHRALVRPNITLPTSTDTSVLWFGYRATNAITSEDAVVVSDQGSRLALTPVVDTSQTNHSEHLMIWKLPSLLTNRGKYRLTLPRANQTLLTFDYE